MAAEHRFDGRCLAAVIQVGGRSVGVDVADLFRHYPAIGQRQLHTGRTAGAARGRGSKVVSIAVGTVAYDLGINFGTAYPGSF